MRNIITPTALIDNPLHKFQKLLAVGPLGAIKTFIANNSASIDWTNKSLFFYACMASDECNNYVISFLLDNKYFNLPIDITCEQGQTAFQKVSSLHRFDIHTVNKIMSYLLSKGADINHIDSYGHSSLSSAIYLEEINRIEFLLSHNASVNILCDSLPPLEYCTKRIKHISQDGVSGEYCSSIVKLLLSHAPALLDSFDLTLELTTFLKKYPSNPIVLDLLNFTEQIKSKHDLENAILPSPNPIGVIKL